MTGAAAKAINPMELEQTMAQLYLTWCLLKDSAISLNVMGFA
jgi:hypothetical protein